MDGLLRLTKHHKKSSTTHQKTVNISESFPRSSEHRYLHYFAKTDEPSALPNVTDAVSLVRP